jgi:hypothetical protein
LVVDSQNLLPDRQKVSPYITAFYQYSIFTFTLEILLAVICTDPGSEVLSFIGTLSCRFRPFYGIDMFGPSAHARA